MQCLSNARQRRAGLRAAVASIAMALALPLTAAVASAQTGTIVGTIIDQATQDADCRRSRSKSWGRREASSPAPMATTGLAVVPSGADAAPGHADRLRRGHPDGQRPDRRRGDGGLRPLGDAGHPRPGRGHRHPDDPAGAGIRESGGRDRGRLGQQGGGQTFSDLHRRQGGGRRCHAELGRGGLELPDPDSRLEQHLAQQRPAARHRRRLCRQQLFLDRWRPFSRAARCRRGSTISIRTRSRTWKSSRARRRRRLYGAAGRQRRHPGHHQEGRGRPGGVDRARRTSVASTRRRSTRRTSARSAS